MCGPGLHHQLLRAPLRDADAERVHSRFPKLYIYIYTHVYMYICHICHILYTCFFGPRLWHIEIRHCVKKKTSTVSFHDFKLSVSNPKNKYAAYVSVLSRISNCQGLGRKNKFEIVKTYRTITRNDITSLSKYTIV